MYLIYELDWKMMKFAALFLIAVLSFGTANAASINAEGGQIVQPLSQQTSVADVTVARKSHVLSSANVDEGQGSQPFPAALVLFIAALMAIFWLGVVRRSGGVTDE